VCAGVGESDPEFEVVPAVLTVAVPSAITAKAAASAAPAATLWVRELVLFLFVISILLFPWGFRLTGRVFPVQSPGSSLSYGRDGARGIGRKMCLRSARGANDVDALRHLHQA